eukprot:TRINITY_DN45949_c0_g1_i1.p1 TRINITY_DN45949_c0_g1~~TRINITY_DN45949_c0_g1_i1.p1  ORF type:complete len:592 (+),score=85.53 TRINITY_DN45949_c0_g1_i1:38-1777(+)
MDSARIAGCVVEWDGKTGFIELDDPESVDDGSDSFVYVDSEDLAVPGSLSVGVSVDFRLARDQHGLLAADVQVYQKESSTLSSNVAIPSEPITGKRTLVLREFCSGIVEQWDPASGSGCIRLPSKIHVADPHFDPEDLVPFHEQDVDEAIGGLGTQVEFLIFRTDQFVFGAEHVKPLDEPTTSSFQPTVAPKRAATHQAKGLPSVGQWSRRILPPRPKQPIIAPSCKAKQLPQPRGSAAIAMDQEDGPPEADSGFEDAVADDFEAAAWSVAATTSSRAEAKNVLVERVPEIMRPQSDLETDWPFEELCKRIIKYVEKGLAVCGPERLPWDQTVRKFLDRSLQSFSAACAGKPWFLNVEKDMQLLFCDVAERLVHPPSREKLEALVGQEYLKITEQRMFEETIWTALHRAFPNSGENACKKAFTALTRAHAVASKETKENQEGSNMARIKAFAKTWIHTSMGRAHTMGLAADLTEAAMLELFRCLVHPDKHATFSCVPKELLQKTGRPPRNWDFLRPTIRDMIASWEGDHSQTSQANKRRKRNHGPCSQEDASGELEGAPGEMPQDEVPVVKQEDDDNSE